MPRATKIVATLGPACSEPDTLTRLLAAGVDVVRMNFSHGKGTDHLARAQHVRDAAHKLGREVAIMADLQGPKIRVGKFAGGKVQLEPGQRFVLDAELKIGDATQVGLDYKELPRDVAPGAILLLNDEAQTHLPPCLARFTDHLQLRFPLQGSGYSSHAGNSGVTRQLCGHAGRLRNEGYV